MRAAHTFSTYFMLGAAIAGGVGLLQGMRCGRSRLAAEPDLIAAPCALALVVVVVETARRDAFAALTPRARAAEAIIELGWPIGLLLGLAAGMAAVVGVIGGIAA